MRLRQTDITQLRQAVTAIAPDAVAIRLFGSRLDDNAKGGDIDLMIDFNQPIERPALLCSRLAVSISLAMQGCAVDVILRAPNLLKSAIHKLAEREGILI
jgi:predicted nucleotidyltransferase